MYKILAKQELVPNIHLIKVLAPDVAKKAQPGQFVIITIDERGERIPLTIADWDREGGAITIVFMEVGTQPSAWPYLILRTSFTALWGLWAYQHISTNLAPWPVLVVATV